MNLDALLASVRQTPGDVGLHNVLADAWLSTGDPRGALARAQLDGRTPAADVLEACVARVRQAAPGATQIRFDHGLVTRLHLDAAAVPDLDADWLATEPLVTLAFFPPYVRSDEDRTEHEATFRAAGPVLAKCRGWSITGHVDEAWWPAVRDLLDAAPLQRLDIAGFDLPDPGSEDDRLPDLPTVTVANLGSNTATILRLLPQLPDVQILQLAGDAGALLDEVLALPQLVHLDLRGADLSELARSRLRAWATDGRTVRHPALSLAPPEGEDPFGARGIEWTPGEPPRRRLAVVPDAEMTFATARDTTLRLHLRDDPHWQRTSEVPFTALVGAPGEIVAGRADGVVESWSAEDGERTPIATLSGAVRTLAACGENVAATYDGGWWTSRGEEGDEGFVAVVLTPGGRAWASGTTVHHSNGRSVDLGDPVLALAADDEVLYAVAGHRVWRLSPTDDGYAPEAVGTCSPEGRARVTAHGPTMAWITSSSGAHSVRSDGSTSMYSGSYTSHSGDADLVVADVVATSDDTVVLALEHGGINILTPTGALKADEHPGEPKAEWLFFHNGQILMTS